MREDENGSASVTGDPRTGPRRSRVRLNRPVAVPGGGQRGADSIGRGHLDAACHGRSDAVGIGGPGRAQVDRVRAR